MPDPITPADDPHVQRLARIVAARGITAPEEEDYGLTPDDPGHPDYHHRRRVDAALLRWDTATPPLYRNATATHPDVVDWAHRAATDPRTARSLLLTGTTGTGKTHQAYGALRAIAETGPDRFEMVATTTADMYGSLRPNGPTEPEHELRRLRRVPLLILDDLGTAKVSEWTEEVTYRLINYRYNHCLPTIFTSNHPVTVTDRQRQQGQRPIGDFLSDRIVSRLAEMTAVIAMVGADRRRGAA